MEPNMSPAVSGRAVGGKARAAKLSPERRKEIAKKALDIKNENLKLPKATHGSSDNPLRIGDVAIPCYVLEDGTRILSQRGVIAGLGMKRGSSGEHTTGDRLSVFLSGKAISPFVSSELRMVIDNPIKFKAGNATAFGYSATILADICDLVLSARKTGKLLSQQMHIADQCEILVRGFARVGIIALVDEATGYQKDREKDSLAKILEAFVAKELQPYMRAFPADYYEELFRLRGLKYPPEKNPHFRPQYFGSLTNDIVYERLAPGLLEEIKKQANKDEKKAHLHRRLTQDIGHPKLRERLASITAIMKLSTDYKDFIGKLNRIHKRFGEQEMLKLEDVDR